jgi:hypothetical protein
MNADDACSFNSAGMLVRWYAGACMYVGLGDAAAHLSDPVSGCGLRITSAACQSAVLQPLA